MTDPEFAHRTRTNNVHLLRPTLALDLRKGDRFEAMNVTFRAVKVRWETPLVWVVAVLDDPGATGLGFIDLWLPERTEVVADSPNGREAARDRLDDLAAKWDDLPTDAALDGAL